MNTVDKGSKTFMTAMCLTMVGGYLDGYTYVSRGGVFENAQTGNMIKLAIAIAERNFASIPRFLFSICAFICGVLVVLTLTSLFQKHHIRHIRRTILLIEICILIMTGFIPQTNLGNFLSACCISFVCAMQMEAFPSFKHGVFATTVATGNLRKMIEQLWKYIKEQDISNLFSTLQYFIVIIFFMSGVFIGVIGTQFFSIHATWIPVFILSIVFLHLHIQYKKILQSEQSEQ